MTHWNRLKYENGMSHVVADDLLLAVQETMNLATPPGLFESTGSVDAICLECGGPCAMGRPHEEVVFYDLQIKIPCEDFEELLDQWKMAPQVVAHGQDFYRFTGWPWQCLVVTTSQRTELLELLEGRREQAELRAKSFWTNWSLQPANGQSS